MRCSDLATARLSFLLTCDPSRRSLLFCRSLNLRSFHPLRLYSASIGKWLAALIVFAMSLSSDSVLAQQAAVELGLQGHFRLGAWTPVRVTGIETGPVAIRCTDPTGSIAQFELGESNAGFVGSVQITNADSRCVIVAGEASTPVVAFVPSELFEPHRQSEQIWLSSTPAGFDLAAERFNESADDIDRATSVVGSLASDWTDQQRVDALSVANVVVATESLDEAASNALQTWVADGGHLLIADSIGLDVAEGESPIDGENGIPNWVPVRVDDSARFRELNALESSVPAGRGLRIDAAVEGVKLRVEDGVVEIDSSYGPILTRSPYGFGRVSVFALPLGSDVLQRWNSLGSMCLILADLRPTVIQRRSANKLTTSGVSEMQTQLLAAVDASRGPGRARPTQWTIMGRLLVYAIAVGLIDYLLVHFLLRKPQLTWITMPLWAIGVFAVASYDGTSGTGSSQESVRSIRTLSIVDHDVSSGYTRTSALNSVASRDRDRLTAKLQTNPFANASERAMFPADRATARLSWLTVPEDTFGGLYRGTTIRSNALQYTVSPDRQAFAGVPIEPRGTRLFHGEWSALPNENDLSNRDRLFRSDLVLNGTRPSGTIEHRFPGVITDWALIVGRTFVRPRVPTPLKPGEPFEMNRENSVSRSLRDVMIGLKRLQVPEGEKGKRMRNTATRRDYDPTSLNHGETLLTATFYERAGGLEYTGIRNSGAPAGFDFSKQLSFDRIVLFGVLDTPVDAIEMEDGTRVAADEAVTYVRIVAPLRSEATSTDSADEP